MRGPVEEDQPGSGLRHWEQRLKLAAAAAEIMQADDRLLDDRRFFPGAWLELPGAWRGDLIPGDRRFPSFLRAWEGQEAGWTAKSECGAQPVGPFVSRALLDSSRGHAGYVFLKDGERIAMGTIVGRCSSCCGG